VSTDDIETITIALGDNDYPELLTQLRDPPETLYIKGNVDALHLPALAIVGSRNPTSGGARNAFEFSRHMAGCGFCIVSGLAQGIDAAAHRGALDAGSPTIAFLGHGIDIVYPPSNQDLAQEIAKTGALVSEYPPGTPPLKAYFPQRNRLISGLSLGTLVVEAARRSGSLITARLAAEQGREVFALPGSIHNPMSRGCHQLLRDGAKLVESADDIMAELGPLAMHVLQIPDESRANDDPASEHDEEYVKLQENMGHDPIGIDELVESSGLTIDQVSSMLLILELDGKIEKLSGGRYALLH
jgi:DNA processing protein